MYEYGWFYFIFNVSIGVDWNLNELFIGLNLVN